MRQGAVCPGCSREVEIETNAQKNFCMWCGATLYPAAIVDARRRQMLTYMILFLILAVLLNQLYGHAPAASPQSPIPTPNWVSPSAQGLPATAAPSPLPKKEIPFAP